MFDGLYYFVTIRAVREPEEIIDTTHYRSSPGNSAVSAVRFYRKYRICTLSPTIVGYHNEPDEVPAWRGSPALSGGMNAGPEGSAYLVRIDHQPTPGYEWYTHVGTRYST